MHNNVCLFQEMADGFARLKTMRAALDTLQEKEDIAVARNKQEQSSSSDDTLSSPHGSQALRRLAEAFSKPANSRMMDTLMYGERHEGLCDASICIPKCKWYPKLLDSLLIQQVDRKHEGY
jgi:hypothetical protein